MQHWHLDPRRCRSGVLLHCCPALARLGRAVPILADCMIRIGAAKAYGMTNETRTLDRHCVALAHGAMSSLIHPLLLLLLEPNHLTLFVAV